MAATQLGCSGLAALLKLIEEHKDASKIYVLFCGEHEMTGESWCPDCSAGEYAARDFYLNQPKLGF